MPIQITAKRDGFRRCGMAHSDKTQTYADDHFSAAQLAVLEAEDQLVVVRLSDQQLSAASAGAASDQLRAAQVSIETLTEKLRGETAQLDAAHVQIEKLNGELTQATTDLNAQQETITAQAAEIESLKAQVQSLTPADDKAKK